MKQSAVEGGAPPRPLKTGGENELMDVHDGHVADLSVCRPSGNMTEVTS